MSETTNIRAQRGDLWGPDCLPACPKCSDLAPVHAKWCPSCGCALILGVGRRRRPPVVRRPNARPCIYCGTPTRSKAGCCQAHRDLPARDAVAA